MLTSCDCWSAAVVARGNKTGRKWLIIKPGILALPVLPPVAVIISGVDHGYTLVIAKHEETELALLPALANRHGLITGATGTGKTITLQLLAERFSAIGVPVFMADVKGDLSGLAAPGSLTPEDAGAPGRARRHGLRAGEMPGHLLGCFRRAGTSGARDDFGHGAGVAGAAAESQRHAGRVCCNWCSGSLTTTACCCSISRICGR
jgi:hypothetical protein